ncbi:hypothetical protein IEQ34_014018 [Dendrobium chrysotoxum]|uniref:Uncharacterized protein n=1 Tax=Dendrobium chrysotoxum TaxID=161865 RepID=A0AAV7GJ16_DENCH|nr:hypothetical protein IEQ34_014018 [Dendrobium chrysotoxum]
MSSGHLPLHDPVIRGDPIALNDSERRAKNGARVDDAASTITGDSLIFLHMKFHFSNDVVTMVPKRSDRAGLPPPKYQTICKTGLRIGLRFPPSVELVEILVRCGVCLSQFLYKAISVIVGLIALFRDQVAILTP